MIPLKSLNNGEGFLSLQLHFNEQHIKANAGAIFSDENKFSKLSLYCMLVSVRELELENSLLCLMQFDLLPLEFRFHSHASKGLVK